MVLYFGSPTQKVFGVQVEKMPTADDLEKLVWLFGNQNRIDSTTVDGWFIGPRAAMITPWSTNAVEITQNMAINGIQRIEEYHATTEQGAFDPMLSQKYAQLNQEIFTINIQPEPVKAIEDIASFNESEGLALNGEEVAYLNEVAERIGRPLTDSEVFGFSQVNSEQMLLL